MSSVDPRGCKCRNPEDWTDEKLAELRGEPLAQWLAFKATFEPVPDHLRPGVFVTLLSDVQRPRRVFEIVCVHGSDVGLRDTTSTDRRASLAGWSVVRDVVESVQLDLFGGAA